jgi:hypothetical protein
VIPPGTHSTGSTHRGYTKPPRPTQACRNGFMLRRSLSRFPSQTQHVSDTSVRCRGATACARRISAAIRSRWRSSQTVRACWTARGLGRVRCQSAWRPRPGRSCAGRHPGHRPHWRARRHTTRMRSRGGMSCPARRPAAVVGITRAVGRRTFCAWSLRPCMAMTAARMAVARDSSGFGSGCTATEFGMIANHWRASSAASSPRPSK